TLRAAKDKALIEALSKPEREQDPAEIEQLRKSLVDAETRLKATATLIEKEFPDFAALASPKPLAVDDVRKLLGPQEALLFWLTDEGLDEKGKDRNKQSYLFALTRESFEWKTVPLSAQALAGKVATFRRELDVDVVTKPAAGTAKPELFDLG